MKRSSDVVPEIQIKLIWNLERLQIKEGQTWSLLCDTCIRIWMYFTSFYKSNTFVVQYILIQGD